MGSSERSAEGGHENGALPQPRALQKEGRLQGAPGVSSCSWEGVPVAGKPWEPEAEGT